MLIVVWQMPIYIILLEALNAKQNLTFYQPKRSVWAAAGLMTPTVLSLDQHVKGYRELRLHSWETVVIFYTTQQQINYYLLVDGLPTRELQRQS